MSSTCEMSPTRRDPRAEPEERGHDRQAHREEGAEADQQDDDRREQPDRGRRGGLARTRSARSPARRARPGAAASGSPRPWRPRCLIAPVGSCVRPLVEEHGREGRSCRPREMRSPLPGSKGLTTPVTCGSAATRASIGEIGRARRAVRDRARAGVEDDLVGVARLGREGALRAGRRPAGSRCCRG